MTKDRNALRAGIFMIVSVVLVIFVVIAISGAGRFTQRFNTYLVAFTLQDDIGGLRVGDDVRVGGLKVGNVEDISIDPKAANVIVSIEVPAKYPMAKDASVSVQKTLTGGAAINVDNFGAGEPVASGDTLHGRPDSLTALFRKAGDFVPDIHIVLGNLKSATGKLDSDLDKFGLVANTFSETGFTATATVDALRVRLPEIVDRYDDLVAEAIGALHSVREFVGPSSGDFHSTVRNLNQITTSVNDRVPDILNRLRTILAKLDVSGSRAAAAMQDIQATVANTKELTGVARAIIVGNRSKLDGFIASLKATADNLKYTSVEIRHSPWRVLYQPKPDEMANLNTYDSVRQFAEAADSLDDAASSLRDVLKDKNVDPDQVKMLMGRLDDSFGKFHDVEQKLWKDIKP
jgi:phospholipid/cholesterol/gamma-HCH transport system substrate-binding protein